MGNEATKDRKTHGGGGAGMLRSDGDAPAHKRPDVVTVSSIPDSMLKGCEDRLYYRSVSRGRDGGASIVVQGAYTEESMPDFALGSARAGPGAVGMLYDRDSGSMIMLRHVDKAQAVDIAGRLSAMGKHIASASIYSFFGMTEAAFEEHMKGAAASDPKSKPDTKGAYYAQAQNAFGYHLSCALAVSRAASIPGAARRIAEAYERGGMLDSAAYVYADMLNEPAKAADLYRGEAERSGEADRYFEAGEQYIRAGDTNKARGCADAIMDACGGKREDSDDYHMLADAGKLYASLGMRSEALKIARIVEKEAYSRYEDGGDDNGLFYSAAEIYRRLGMEWKAKKMEHMSDQCD